MGEPQPSGVYLCMTHGDTPCVWFEPPEDGAHWCGYVSSDSDCRWSAELLVPQPESEPEPEEWDAPTRNALEDALTRWFGDDIYEYLNTDRDGDMAELLDALRDEGYEVVNSLRYGNLLDDAERWQSDAATLRDRVCELTAANEWFANRVAELEVKPDARNLNSDPDNASSVEEWPDDAAMDRVIWELTDQGFGPARDWAAVRATLKAAGPPPFGSPAWWSAWKAVIAERDELRAEVDELQAEIADCDRAALAELVRDIDAHMADRNYERWRYAMGPTPEQADLIRKVCGGGE